MSGEGDPASVGGESDASGPVSSEDLDEDDAAFLRAVARAPEAELEAPAPSQRTPLTRLAHFAELEEIGRGGMGIVFRARDEKLGRVVALKVLPDDFEGDDGRRKRFFREARVAASISHPNVAAVHEVGEADGKIYIAMELVSGTTLRKRAAGKELPIAEALRIFQAAARGVAKAHALGIAHRDLKPDNVMVDDEGAVKVLDFGLAKATDPSTSGATDAPENDTGTLTREGKILGTPGYMSPEQATGRSLDVRTDVFSLGVILYELVTGTRPFTGETTMDVVIATSRDRPEPPSERSPRVGRGLEAVILRCLEKDPAQRYADARALLAAIDALPPEELREAAPRRRAGRTRGLWMGALGAAAAVGLVVANAASSRGAPTPMTPEPGLRIETSANARAPERATLAEAPARAASSVASAPAAIATAQAAPPPPTRPVTLARPAKPVASAAPSSAPAPVEPARVVTTPGGVIQTSPY